MLIGKHRENFNRGEQVQFAIIEGERGFLIGGIGLNINKAYENAEIGYWIAKPY